LYTNANADTETSDTGRETDTHKKSIPVITTSRSGMSAAGAEMTKDVDWLALTRPRPSPRTVTLNGSITVKQNGLPASHTHVPHTDRYTGRYR